MQFQQEYVTSDFAMFVKDIIENIITIILKYFPILPP